MKKVRFKSSHRPNESHLSNDIRGKSYCPGDEAGFDDVYAHRLVNEFKCASFVDKDGRVVSNQDSTPAKNVGLAEYSAPQAKEYVDSIENVEVLSEFIDLEEKGKNRKTIINVVNARIDAIREAKEAAEDFAKALAECKEHLEDFTKVEEAEAFLEAAVENKACDEHIALIHTRIAELAAAAKESQDGNEGSNTDGNSPAAA